MQLADIISFPAMAAIEYLRCLVVVFNILYDKKEKKVVPQAWKQLMAQGRLFVAVAQTLLEEEPHFPSRNQ